MSLAKRMFVVLLAVVSVGAVAPTAATASGTLCDIVTPSDPKFSIATQGISSYGSPYTAPKTVVPTDPVTPPRSGPGWIGCSTRRRRRRPSLI